MATLSAMLFKLVKQNMFEKFEKKKRFFFSLYAEENKWMRL